MPGPKASGSPSSPLPRVARAGITPTRWSGTQRCETSSSPAPTRHREATSRPSAWPGSSRTTRGRWARSSSPRCSAARCSRRCHRAQLRYGEAGWADAIAVPESGWVHADPVEAADALDAHLAPVIEALNGRRAPRGCGARPGTASARRSCGAARRSTPAKRRGRSAPGSSPRRPACRGPARFELRDGVPVPPTQRLLPGAPRPGRGRVRRLSARRQAATSRG